MKRTNEIVRTRTVNKDERGDHYDIDLMTYWKYLQRSEFVFVNTQFELYPYKWYDLRWLIDYQFYYLSKSLNKDFNNARNLNSIKSITIRIILFFIEAIISTGISMLIMGN
ncbi:hypothetical protein N8Z47_05135 [Salibacteraceae bacterium]|nr:hypothetical protein [Salibacteraceae bacterium]